MKSKQSGFVDQVAFGKPADAQLVCVREISAAVQDEVGQYFAGRRSVHHAVPAEAVCEKESRDLRNRTEDGVVVWRHLVEAGPRPLRIDCKILETWHPIGGAGEYLFHEGGVKIRVVAVRLLFRIIPRQQKA